MHNQFDYVQMKYTVMSQKTEMKCNLYTFLDRGVYSSCDF